MTTINATLDRPRSVESIDISDITTEPYQVLRDEWGDPHLVFEVTLTQQQIDAIINRLNSSNTNEEQLRDQAESAITQINDYLALTSPTNAQVAAQVRLLSQAVRGLIKLELRDLASA